MALDMTPEQKKIGEDNFNRSVGQLAQTQNPPNRRQFMKGLLAGGAVVPVAAAAYYGYNQNFGERPVKAALIGAGDEGGVLVGEHNPRFLEFVAFSDIRPSNYQERIFTGEYRGPRRGLNHHYGNQARSKIRHFLDWRKMLENVPEIEAVVIALPLHLHAPVAIECMRRYNKHVLCEKLMAWNIRQCKEMAAVARETGKVLSIGHQRHYSMLYAHAVEVLRQGILGDIHHIRALWHRENSNRLPGDPPTDDPQLMFKDSWCKPIPGADKNADHLTDANLRGYGFNSLRELIRWRLFHRTGGGLMAELGSHQLDACSIFLQNTDSQGNVAPVYPLAVSAVGGNYYYGRLNQNDDREVEDHVFCTYEFPGKNFDPQKWQNNPNEPNDIVVMTYSSINTNDFEPYGECVMGTNGTMVIQSEQSAMLWGVKGRSTNVTVSNSSGGPALNASATEDDVAGASGAQSLGQRAVSSPPSRGYREEMEHFAYVIRQRESGEENAQVRCHGDKALADAVMALAANASMEKARRGQPHRIVFQNDWFNAQSDARPEWDAEAVPYPEA